jgi:hypothetical protein
MAGINPPLRHVPIGLNLELLVEAYREYARDLTPDNWKIMQTNLLKVVEVAGVAPPSRHPVLAVRDEIDRLIAGRVMLTNLSNSMFELVRPQLNPQQ